MATGGRKRVKRSSTAAGADRRIRARRQAQSDEESVKAVEVLPEESAEQVAWERQPLIEKLVTELVEKYHAHLTRARIIVLGKPKASKSLGKVNVAKAKRTTPAIQALLKDASGTDVHYLIEVGMDAWAGLSARQRRATIDHELHHFTGLDIDDAGRERWGLRGHDVGEFVSVVRRYGAYHADLEVFVAEVRQLKLPGMEPASQ